MPRPVPRPALVLLFVVALLLRLAPLDHGLPRPYVPDSHVVRNALGMLRDRDPVPEVGRYSTYPYLVPYLLLPVYAAEYAVGRATGAWGGPQEFGLRATLDPHLTSLPARALMALLGALTAVVLVLAARAAGLEAGAWAAGWLVATSLLNVQMSTQERPWAALVFFGALCLWGAVLHERRGRTRPLLLAGVAAGLSFGCHQAGLMFLALCGLAWAFAPGGWRGPQLRRRLLRGVACVALFGVVNLVAGQPYYLVHGRVAQDAVVGGELAAETLSIGGLPVRFGLSLDSLERLSQVYFGYEPALVVLGLAGLLLLGRRTGTRCAAAFIVLAGGFFLTNPSDHVRYLLPVGMVLALSAGVVCERMRAHQVGFVVGSLLLALPLLQALRLDWVLAREDTRAQAERKLAALPAGARVAIDHYGPAVDLTREALERVEGLRGELYTRERTRLELLRADALPPEQAGLDALPVQELFEVDLLTQRYGVRERVREHGATPAEVLAALGATHLLLVDRRPGDDTLSELAGLAEGRPVVWTISPAPDARTPREAFLPTEMDFPLIGLWAVERPGPWMQLVELAPPGAGR